MTVLTVQTGGMAAVETGHLWSEAMFGSRYTGFRSLDRFEEQLGGNGTGLITWPGGYLSETAESRYGLGFDGLFNPDENRPGLAEMFDLADRQGAALAIILPTARYVGNDALLRADIRNFMGDLLSGQYGAAPSDLIFEIGSEYYVNFPVGATEARDYGHIANIYMEELSAALNNPAVNLIGLDPVIAVQAGRTLADDEIIRDQLSDDALVEVDQIVHHRFAFNATGVDKGADQFHTVIEAWRMDAAELGGDGPDLFLSAYGVGSYTRDEALRDFLAADKAAGGTLSARDVDLQARTHTGFETFWQQQLGLRDYGAEHPRLLLEMMSEYGAEGMVAASSHGTDMIHPGRLSLEDGSGVAQKFIGQEMLDMMAESIGGTRSLSINLQNDRADEIWTYGFENDDKLVIFLSADSTPPDGVTLKLSGLGSVYRQVTAESLTARTPDDWMARFGIADNPEVDETPEAGTFALGVRQAVTPVVTDGAVEVGFSAPNEVIRLSFAKTAAGAAEIATFTEAPTLQIGPEWTPDELAGGGPQVMLHSQMADLPMVPMEEPEPDSVTHADSEVVHHDSGGAGEGGFALALMPLLFLFGL